MAASLGRSAAMGRVTTRSTTGPAARGRCKAVEVRAFFNFGGPKTAARPAADPRRTELAGELISVCAKSAPSREQIEELVEELAPLGVKNPLKSPLLWGNYEVAYCSQPTAVGGPLKKGAGPVLFPGQRAVQKLVQPNELINEVTFSPLGFLKGFSRQYGTIKPLDGDTFLLTIDRGELNTGLGTQPKDFDIQRRIRVIYLDEQLRIARFLPDEDLQDSEGASEDDILFVFKRVADSADEEDEEEEEEEDEGVVVAAAPKLPSLPLFGGTGKAKAAEEESLATRAERAVQQRAAAAKTPSGTQKRTVGGTQKTAAASGTQTRRPGTGFLFAGSRSTQEEDDEEEEETPAQKRAREQKEAAAARARAQAEAREAAKQQAEKAKAEARAAAEKAKAEARAAAEKAKAEAEREAARKRAEKEREEARARAEKEKEEQRARAAAIREQLAELSDDLKEAQAAAREVAKDLADARREAAPILKRVTAAEAAIAQAAAEAAQAAAALQQAAEERKQAEGLVKEAQAAAREAEAAYKKAQQSLAVRS